MSIVVDNIVKTYGKQIAVDHLSFEVNKGEVVGFLGPNGAGKTSTMKMICGYLQADSGNIKVCNEAVSPESTHFRQNIGYLPENNPLYLEMYIKEYLHFVAKCYNVGKNAPQMIQTAMERTGLLPEQHKKIQQLSKGYRQRVGLAQAILHQPEVLILDEATSGLDPNQLHEIRQLIREIGSEKSVLLSTHIMQEVEALCDRIIIINKGKILANEKTESLKNKHQGNIYRIEFLEKVPLQQLQNHFTKDTVKSLDSTQNVFHLQQSAGLNEDLRPEIFNFSVKNNFTLIGLQKEQNRLEDVFQAITQMS